MIRALVFLAALLFPALAHAQCAPLPFTFVPGTTIASAQVNANFNSVFSCANSASGNRAPIIATKALLAASATTTFPGGVWRSDFAPGVGAQPLWYLPSNAACSLNAGAGDGGSQVSSADGKCWLAVFDVPGYSVLEWGADSTGGTDSTTAFNACLAAAAKGMCIVPAKGKFEILGNLSIPASTTLWCASPMTDGQDAPANYSTAAAIMLDSGHTISATGTGAGIASCLIYRNGMTFPATNSSAYAGIAISDGGFAGFFVTDSTIIGFDTCIKATGDRGYFRRVYMDGAGVTNAVFNWQNGNTDSGYAEDIKIQPFGTGNGSCTASPRAGGTGMKYVGINFLKDFVIQNYQIDYDFAGGLAIFSGTMWSDGQGTLCGYGTTIGVKVEGGALLFGGNLNLNNTQTGVQFLAATATQNSSNIGSIFVNVIGQDGVQVGGTGISGGVVNVGLIATNPANLTGNAGRYLINMADSTAASSLNVGTINAEGVNGNAAPYVNSVTTNNVIGVQFNAQNVVTNLTPGTSPYSGFTFGTGATPSIRGIFPSITSCTGATVACALSTSADVNAGAVVMTVGGGTPTSGTIQLTFTASSHTRSCQFFPANGTGSWTAPKFIQTAVAATTNNLTWSDSALGAGTFIVNYNCPTE